MDFVIALVCWIGLAVFGAYYFHYLLGFSKPVFTWKEEFPPNYADGIDREMHSRMRKESDELADEVVIWLRSGDSEAVKIREGWETKNILTCVQEGANAGNESCIRFLNDINRVPDWIDQDKIVQGQEFFRRYPTACLSSLLLSLMASYLSENGSSVLLTIKACTGRLKSDTRRRLTETMYMVLAVNFGSLEPGSKAHTVCFLCLIDLQALVEVRLLHSEVRCFIKRAVKWDVDVRGIPINQQVSLPRDDNQDMLATTGLFSSMVIDGCIGSGVRVTPEERDAVNALWQVCGFYLGLKEEYIPRSYQEEIQIRKYIGATQVSRNPVYLPSFLFTFRGKTLSNALVANIERPDYKRGLLYMMAPSICSLAELTPPSPQSQVATFIVCYLYWLWSQLQRFSQMQKLALFVARPIVYLTVAFLSRMDVPDEFHYRFRLSSKRHPRINPKQSL